MATGGRAWAVIVALGVATAAAAYRNPLPMTGPGGMTVQSCADPTVIQGKMAGDTAWYLYCTRDPLGDTDRDAQGNLVFRNIPTFRSDDLTHWTYVGDAIPVLPAWASPAATLWAPEIQFFGGVYHLYFAVTDTRASGGGTNTCGSDSAIGVATSASPTGPWTVAAAPAVAPRRSGTGCSFYATIDPEVVTDDAGQTWIYYGSFDGGIEARTLSADGLSSNAATAVAISIANRYEGAEVVRRDGFYYLFGSATDCCRGPLTGYAVFVARSTSPAGPFADREGNTLLAGRVGGDVALAFNANGFTGPGHNTVFADATGQTWTIYHAVVEADPYFSGSVGFTKRPAMMDALDWIDGWPVVRGGFRVSSCPQADPAAQAGQTPTYLLRVRGQEAPGAPLPAASDELDGALGPQWSWIRPPAPSAWGFDSGGLRFATQAADLYVDDNSAPVLVEPAPAGDWIAETRVSLDLPAEGCCHDYVQAGLVAYGDDDDYLKLVHVSIGATRQTEWAKEVSTVPPGYPRYGNSVVGAPSGTTWLRIAKEGHAFTAFTSGDGTSWQRGATWSHDLGGAPKIGLVAMGGGGFTAHFDYVHVSTLVPAPPHPDEGPPGDVTGVTLSGHATTTIAWGAAARATVYDVSRGVLSALSSSPLGSCFADDVTATETTDPATPPPGDGWFYTVRGVHVACGGAAFPSACP